MLAALWVPRAWLPILLAKAPQPPAHPISFLSCCSSCSKAPLSEPTRPGKVQLKWLKSLARTWAGGRCWTPCGGRTGTGPGRTTEGAGIHGWSGGRSGAAYPRGDIFPPLLGVHKCSHLLSWTRPLCSPLCHLLLQTVLLLLLFF